MKKIILLFFTFCLRPTFADLSDGERALNLMKSNMEQMSKVPRVGLVDLTCNSKAPLQSGILPALTEEFFDNGVNCSMFIDDEGDYGEWGEVVSTYIRSHDEKELFLGQTLKGMGPPHEICPNWGNLNTKQKEHFWVWTFAAISWKESSCNPKARNGNATNGVAIGLLQLDEGTKNRSWRGPNCRAKVVTKAFDNLRCGLDIMTEILKAEDGDYRSNGFLYGKKNNSYWQDLKKESGGRIGELIRTYPPCQK